MISKTIRQGCLILGMLTYGGYLFALPFTVYGVANSPFPTIFIKNNTNITRKANTFLHKNFENLTLLPGSCTTSFWDTFDLNAKGQAGDSCILSLDVYGPYTNNPSLLICAKGEKTCAGSPIPSALNSSLNTKAINLNAIATLGANVYVGGLDNHDVTTLWQYNSNSTSGVYQEWTRFAISTQKLGINSIATSDYNGVRKVFFGGTQIAQGAYGAGWVNLLNPDNNTISDLNFQTNSDNGIAVNAIVSDGSEGIFVGGIVNPTNSLNGPVYGELWHYNAGAWSKLNLHQNDPDLTNVVAIAFNPNSSILYEANMYLYNDDIPYAQVRSYSGGVWQDTNLPNPTADNYLTTINALALDGDGNVYAAGQNVDYVGAIWVYDHTNLSWTAIAAPVSSTINSLAFDQNGNLYAGGYDGAEQVGQVWHTSPPFDLNNVWLPVTFNSSVINSSTINGIANMASANTLYTLGVFGNSLPKMWAIKTN